MPHIIVKMYPGRSNETKQKLVDEIVKKVAESTGCSDEAISVALEETAKEDWPEKVYRPDIMEKADTLYKKPGYNPLKG